MDLPHFGSLPEWRERLTDFDGEEAGKYKEELRIAEAMYNQWREVFRLVSAFAEALPEEEDELLSTKSMISQNAYIVSPKIMSACGNTLYMIKMENAALIRFNCRQLWEQVAFAVLEGNADGEHKEVIEEVIDEFKALFKQGVATFNAAEYEDDWDLF